jgi:glycosyltransferase involved in cell wall biosynthesis
MPRFDYIITIHNKEDLIEKVVFSLLACMRHEGHIWAVVDGCTDGTETILRGLLNDYENLPLTIIHEHDVHEIRSINAGLRALPDDAEGFIISLQDDVLISDLEFENKVIDVYELYGRELGYVSFRLGANLIPADGPLSIGEIDLVETACQPQLENVALAQPGEIAFRDAAIKSPTCIPYYVYRAIGLLDEDLAPYAWDDHEYSVRSLKAGFRNALVPIKFRSDIDWGGTRRTPHPEMPAYHVRNTAIIREKHAEFFAAARERNVAITPIDVGVGAAA